MTRLEARIRRRLFVPLDVAVWYGGEQQFRDEDVIKLRRRRGGVRLWVYWQDKYEPKPRVIDYWFPNPEQVVVERG